MNTKAFIIREVAPDRVLAPGQQLDMATTASSMATTASGKVIAASNTLINLASGKAASPFILVPFTQQQPFVDIVDIKHLPLAYP